MCCHLHHAAFWYRSDGSEVAANLFQAVRHILVEQNGEVGSLRLGLSGVYPTCHVPENTFHRAVLPFIKDILDLFTCVLADVLRGPAKVLWVDVEYPRPGYSSWSSSLQVRDLKEEAHGGGQTDPLITGKGQNLDEEEK